jgi:hypothetical protein
MKTIVVSIERLVKTPRTAGMRRRASSRVTTRRTSKTATRALHGDAPDLEGQAGGSWQWWRRRSDTDPDSLVPGMDAKGFDKEVPW